MLRILRVLQYLTIGVPIHVEHCSNPGCANWSQFYGEC